jgi:hypothetical protein
MGKGYQKVSKLSLEGGFSLFGGFCVSDYRKPRKCEK